MKWNGDGSKLDGVVGKVILPAVMSPVLAALVAGVGTWIVFRIAGSVSKRLQDTKFRSGQVVSASLVSLAHGTNDAQKTMGIITLALVTGGVIAPGSNPPTWVII